MVRLVSDFTANRLRVKPGERYGIEVEAEGCPVDVAGDLRWSDAFHRYWSFTSDGSLRNGGIEFLSKPLPRTYVPPAIDALWDYFREGRMVPSVRTGIHIHANCLGLNTDQVTRILLHYALVEPVMFDFVGPTREENIYCIPWYRGLDEPEAVRNYLSVSTGGGSDLVYRDYREPCKYSAVYVAPLSTFGSIEFRHAPTWTDATTMLRWWQMVQAVWRTHLTDYDVLERWRMLGPVAFAREVLPFDWLRDLPEDTYESLDVESVAAALLPQEDPAPSFWGRAPDLRIEAPAMAEPTMDTLLSATLTGNATIPVRRSRTARFLEEMREEYEESDRDEDEVEDDAWEPSDEDDEEVA